MLGYKGQLQLNPDGSFALSYGNSTGSGHFAVDGDTVSLIYSDGTFATFNIIGKERDELYNDTGVLMYRRQKDAPAVAAPPVAAMKLPSTYVNAQVPVDQLQLMPTIHSRCKKAANPITAPSLRVATHSN
jgi:hypothetical protein